MANVIHSRMCPLQPRCRTSLADGKITVPYKSDWLVGIGLAFFFLNLCLFAINCVMITLRFILHPGSLIRSFYDQVESLFISAIVSQTSQQLLV